MATFPTLKTGAVAQYPIERSLSFSNRVVRFLDGTEQRYRLWPAPLRRWIIRLDLLDEAELAALEQFYLSSQGSFANFAFTDPMDGALYPNCSLEVDRFEFLLEGELRGRTSLVVIQNRS